MELRINPNNVSHIKVFEALKGRMSIWNGQIEYTWREVEYTKVLWIFKTKSVEYKEGYYRTCKRSWLVNDEPIEIKETEFILGDSLWTHPRIEIFAGKELIKTKYFKTFEEAKRYTTKYYPNVNVIC